MDVHILIQPGKVWGDLQRSVKGQYRLTPMQGLGFYFYFFLIKFAEITKDLYCDD